MTLGEILFIQGNICQDVDILKISSLLNYRVSVELPRKTSQIAQCKRCQEIGHSQNYCNKTPRCVKCGDKHLSKECGKLKEAQPKCANCHGPHTANYRGCPAFKDKTSPTLKLTAVDRMKQRVVPAAKEVGKPLRTYAKLASSSTQPVASTTPAVPARQETQQGDLSKILEALARIENNQSNAEKSISNLEKRVGDLEASFNSPSPRARKKTKS